MQGVEILSGLTPSLQLKRAKVTTHKLKEHWSHLIP